ncbi:Cyclopropane mycolic acid synthase 1 [Paraburkholderia nemoris]|uniref:SAM-dependent methyltransferase n=1 Tax=Paraburkholderia nemoris TaxID=2793076 RepID=UPI00190A8599|nr:MULTISPECIES: cyclopropane-fatty-acyl-phospholipid synthase family protein [Paraburkholderia]MBK3787126.1 class I SAM-dependent methyltransferase [Paraburkholderia aspalathi]CAE6867190.1 Cyclopropane mycolic acid synthase 1 [Paraburkholderia nemoris]
MTEAIATAPQAEGGASAQAIQTHYDISNDFYALWLDPTMAYSCALWEAGDTLEKAQLRKLDFHLAQAQATDKGNLLDVGCGWGALLDRAVTNYNVKNAVGLTLSQAQTDWVKASKRDNVSVLLESWSDHQPCSPYDAIVSIGAFEHFAKAGLSKSAKADAYRSFFKWCHDNSTADCNLSLQSIVYENYDEGNPNPFVEEIFPESELPRASEILAACDGLFEVVALRNDRAHYAKTLQCWYAGLRKNREAAIAMMGEVVYEKYEKYLGVFVVGFHTGTVNLTRIKARKIAKPVVIR